MTYMHGNELRQYLLIIGVPHDVYPPSIASVVLLYLHGEDLRTFH